MRMDLLRKTPNVLDLKGHLSRQPTNQHGGGGHRRYMDLKRMVDGLVVMNRYLTRKNFTWCALTTSRCQFAIDLTLLPVKDRLG